MPDVPKKKRISEIYTVSYRPFDGGGEKDALLAAALGEFFASGRAKGSRRGVEDGRPVRVRYRLAPGCFKWKKAGGRAVLQEAFAVGGGFRLVTHGPAGELRSAAAFDAGLRWLRTAYYSGDPARPAAVLRRAGEGLLLAVRGGGAPVRLLPCPARPGTAAQSCVNSRAGEPDVLARTDAGTFCFCREEERALRLKILAGLARDPASLTPRWPGEDDPPAELKFRVIPNDGARPPVPAPKKPKKRPAPGAAEGYAVDREIFLGRAPAPGRKYAVAAKGLSGGIQAAAPPGTSFAQAKPVSCFAGKSTRETPPESLPVNEKNREGARETPPESPAKQSPKSAGRENPKTAPPEKTENQQNPDGGQADAASRCQAVPVSSFAQAKPVSCFAGKGARETPPAGPAANEKNREGARETPPAGPAQNPEQGPEKGGKPPAENNSVLIKEKPPESPPINEKGREVPGTAPPQKAENQQNPDGGRVDAASRCLIPAKRIVVSSMESYLYFGKLINGLREGRGRTQTAGGHTAYEGGYRGDRREGFGVYYYKSGRLCYAGGWKRNLRDGMGVAFGSKDGSIFVGHWKDGVATGRGSAFDMDGNLTYTGGWKNGRRDGRGTEYRAGRVVRTGLWRGDVFLSGYRRVGGEPPQEISGSSPAEPAAPGAPVK